jgi:3-oxoacyl-[acyl-carrier-protein] synthase III
MSVIIKGTGSFIPENKISNQDFFQHEFYSEDGEVLPHTETIIKKFKDITGIDARRYADDGMINSEMASIAAKRAVEDAKINIEEIDAIIYAHNFGNIPKDTIQTDIVPCLATRVKHDLGIKNPNCAAFDIIFGCPGWVQGVILARQYILAGDAKNVLVIGAETLSRVVDPFDRDSMIYSDGAGAAIISEAQTESGILSVASQTFAKDEAYYLFYGKSYKKDYTEGTRYIKMHGRKIYEFALTNVPLAMKACLDKAGVDIKDLKKVFIHQANEKMDEAILQRFYKLYDIKELPPHIMPMSIHELGNSSVATVPTLLDLVLNEKIDDHRLEKGDLILLASVGAGMSINAITYRV